MAAATDNSCFPVDRLREIYTSDLPNERKKELVTLKVAKYFAGSYIFQSSEDSKTKFTSIKFRIKQGVAICRSIKIVLFVASIFLGIGALIRAINAGALLMQAKTFSGIAASISSMAWAAGVNNLFIINKATNIFHHMCCSVALDLPNADSLTSVTNEDEFLNRVFSDSVLIEDLTSSEQSIRTRCLTIAEMPSKEPHGWLSRSIVNYTLILPIQIVSGICNKIFSQTAAPISAQ